MCGADELGRDRIKVLLCQGNRGVKKILIYEAKKINANTMPFTVLVKNQTPGKLSVTVCISYR
jgi:hypothetical protein